MIPASYLYKDIYRQTWLDPDIERVRPHPEASWPRGTPLRRGLAAFLRRAADMLAPTGSHGLASSHS